MQVSAATPLEYPETLSRQPSGHPGAQASSQKSTTSEPVFMRPFPFHWLLTSIRDAADIPWVCSTGLTCRPPRLPSGLRFLLACARPPPGDELPHPQMPRGCPSGSRSKIPAYAFLPSSLTICMLIYLRILDFNDLQR